MRVGERVALIGDRVVTGTGLHVPYCSLLARNRGIGSTVGTGSGAAGACPLRRERTPKKPQGSRRLTLGPLSTRGSLKAQPPRTRGVRVGQALGRYGEEIIE